MPIVFLDNLVRAPECVHVNRYLSIYSLRMNSFLRVLQQQHRQDLALYRRNHQEWRNRWIHYIMIPIECWSLMLLCFIVFGDLGTVIVSTCLAILSLMVGTTTKNKNNSVMGVRMGLLAASFHILTPVTFRAMSRSCTRPIMFAIAVTSWTVAWAAQVGIGHYIMEKNQPNVARIKEVSCLAMLLSVLIAWTS